MNKKLFDMRVNDTCRTEFYQNSMVIMQGQQTEDIKYSEIMLILTSREKKLLAIFIRHPERQQKRQLKVKFRDQTDADKFKSYHHSAQSCSFICKLVKEDCELSIFNAKIRVRFLNDSLNKVYEIGMAELTTPKEEFCVIINFESHREDLEFQSLEDIEQFKQYVNLAEKGDGGDHLEDLDKFKIYILENDAALKKLYQEIVVRGVMSEESFWECRPEFKEYQKLYFRESQKKGKNASLLISDPKLNNDDKRKIMKQYPEVAQLYTREVLQNHTPENERKFWEDFIKLQFDKDTELVGGKNPIVLRLDDLRIEARPDLYYGEVDIARNLDLKLNFAQELTKEKFEDGDKIGATIKKLQIHGLNVLGGVTPKEKFTKFTQEELVREYTDLIVAESEHSKENREHQQMDEEKKNERHIESALPRRHSSHKSGNTSENLGNKLEQILKSNNERERREIFWNKSEMNNVFKDLVSAANIKEKGMEEPQNRIDYEGFHERAKDLLTLYYMSLHSGEKLNERNEITKLINTLIGDIGKCKENKFQNKRNLNPDELKLNKALGTIEETLKHALKVKSLHNQQIKFLHINFKQIDAKNITFNPKRIIKIHRWSNNVQRTLLNPKNRRQ